MRFEEGYNLCIDPLFTRWLKKNHPESVVRSDPVSIEEEFSYITPLSPLNTELFETNMMVDTDYGEKQSNTTEQTDHGNDATELIMKVILQNRLIMKVILQNRSIMGTKWIREELEIMQITEKQETTFLQVTRTQKITLLMKAGKIMPL